MHLPADPNSPFRGNGLEATQQLVALDNDARILVLDDSTSAIDSETEDRIQRAIERAATPSGRPMYRTVVCCDGSWSWACRTRSSRRCTGTTRCGSWAQRWADEGKPGPSRRLDEGKE